MIQMKRRQNIIAEASHLHPIPVNGRWVYKEEGQKKKKSEEIEESINKKSFSNQKNLFDMQQVEIVVRVQCCAVLYSPDIYRTYTYIL